MGWYVVRAVVCVSGDRVLRCSLVAYGGHAVARCLTSDSQCLIGLVCFYCVSMHSYVLQCMTCSDLQAWFDMDWLNIAVMAVYEWHAPCCYDCLCWCVLWCVRLRAACMLSHVLHAVRWCARAGNE